MNDPADVFALPETLRVLVTAGASGIGRAIADLLVARGAEVHICDVADEFLIDYRAAHPSAGVTRADVSSEADVERLFDDVKASLGGLDALINNAGIAGPTGGVEEIKPEDWRRTIDVCLTGQFLCAHFAVPIAQSCRRRFDRQFVLGCGAVRLRISDTVLGCQIWGYRVDPEPRQGARTR